MIKNFISTEIEWSPINNVDVSQDKAKTVTQLLETLEEEDDVQNVYANFKIKKNNMKAGIALNPSTPENSIEHFIDLADLILVMSVEPGYCGQDFHEDAIERVRHYKEAYPNKIIEVDGGVGPSNSERLADAGADILVAGSAIFKADDPIEIVKIMRGS